jgi:hypothetical protein
VSAPESPSAFLLRAASAMRERAQAASEGPWKSWQEGRDHRGGDSMIATGDSHPGSGDICVNVGKGYHAKWEADQDYIAGMHPLVALAVAGWLEAEGKRAAEIDGHEGEPVYALMLAGYRHPVAVARAFLGEPEAEGAER